MTKEEARERLNHMKMFIGYDAENPIVKEMQSALDLASKALEQTRWIPVSERMPEDGQKVLFCTKQGYIHQGKYYGEAKWYSSIRSSWIYFDSIIAWMSLPQPYKTESEETMQLNTPTHEGYTERCNHTQSEGAYDE